MSEGKIWVARGGGFDKIDYEGAEPKHAPGTLSVYSDRPELAECEVAYRGTDGDVRSARSSRWVGTEIGNFGTMTPPERGGLDVAEGEAREYEEVDRISPPEKRLPLDLLFFDIDGVLNTERSFGKRKDMMDYVKKAWSLSSKQFWTLDAAFSQNSDSELDNECVEKLNEVCRKTGAKLVMSSTWRRRPVKAWERLFKCGLDEELVWKDRWYFLREARDLAASPHFCTREMRKLWFSCLGSTDAMDFERVTDNPRGALIKRFVDSFESRDPLHYVRTYAIVDDDTDMLPEQESRFVNTRSEDGILGDGAAKKLVRILKDKSLYLRQV